MSKKLLSERDICTKFISPAIEGSGWNKQTQYLEEVSFTDGKIYVKGRLTTRGARKRADYILYFKPNIPIAIIEAKDNNHSVGSGMQQALNYAEILDIRNQHRTKPATKQASITSGFKGGFRSKRRSSFVRSASSILILL